MMEEYIMRKFFTIISGVLAEIIFAGAIILIGYVISLLSGL